MLRKAAKVPPGGKRLSAVEVERRIDRVVELLRAQASRADILAAMSAEFGAAPRTVDDYIARARDRFAVENAATADGERAATVARLEDLANMLKAKGAWSALVNVERLLVDIRGLRRGTVAVEAAPGSTALAPDVGVEDVMEQCFFAVEHFARGWAKGAFPTPSPEQLERLRAGIRAAADAVGVAVTPSMPPRAARPARVSSSPAGYDDAE